MVTDTVCIEHHCPLGRDVPCLYPLLPPTPRPSPKDSHDFQSRSGQVWDTHCPAPRAMVQKLACVPALTSYNESRGLWLCSRGKMYFLAGLLRERMWSHLIRKERRQAEGLVLQLEIQPYSNSPSLTFLSCQHNVLLRGFFEARLHNVAQAALKLGSPGWPRIDSNPAISFSLM